MNVSTFWETLKNQNKCNDRSRALISKREKKFNIVFATIAHNHNKDIQLFVAWRQSQRRTRKMISVWAVLDAALKCVWFIWCWKAAGEKSYRRELHSEMESMEQNEQFDELKWFLVSEPTKQFRSIMLKCMSSAFPFMEHSVDLASASHSTKIEINVEKDNNNMEFLFKNGNG